MFYAMKFTPTGWKTDTVRAIRVRPYKSLELARKAVERAGQGYVKKINHPIPVWSNVL